MALSLSEGGLPLWPWLPADAAMLAGVEGGLVIEVIELDAQGNSSFWKSRAGIGLYIVEAAIGTLRMDGRVSLCRIPGVVPVHERWVVDPVNSVGHWTSFLGSHRDTCWHPGRLGH